MIICPNLSDSKIKEEFEELVSAVGESSAYRLWSKNGGNPLDKAPNGKSSKLFNDLLELTGDRDEAIKAKAKVYSPEFKSWFGDWNRSDNLGNVSKVVDNNGEPKIVYHGTNEEFDTFKTFEESNVKGIFYTYSKTSAKIFGNVKNLFVNVKNPYIEPDSIQYDSIDTSVINNFFKAKGYDSVITENEMGVVFNPNQIKSVFNEGEFSEKTDNIYYQLDENYENKILKESELLPADPELDAKIANFLKDRGFKVDILDDRNLDYVAKADMLKKIIEVVEVKRNVSTLSEEAAHIFVEMLPDDSPLLKKMMKDITSFEGYQEIYNKYSKKYFYFDEKGNRLVDDNKIKKEAIGKLIANEIINEFKQEKQANVDRLSTWFKRVLEWLKTRFKGGSEAYNKEVYIYREAAKIILNNEVPKNISEVNLSNKKYTYVGEEAFYELAEDAEEKFRETIAKLEATLVIKKKDGYYRLDGTKVPQRVTDFVKSYYRRIFGEEKESDDKIIKRKKGTYVHKILEIIMNKVIDIDVNQEVDIADIITEANNSIKGGMSGILKQAAEEVIIESEDFKGMKPTDDFFSMGRVTKYGTTNSSKAFAQLVNLGVAKYRNIKENQALVDKQSGTKKGKFKILTESIIYNDKESTAGTADMLVVYSNSSVGIYDWKGVFFKTHRGKVIEDIVSEVKVGGWEEQMRQIKNILSEAYGINSFAETRMIPINVQLNFNNPEAGFFNIEAGNTGGKTYLDEVPVADELVRDTVEGSEFLNKSLQNLFNERNKLREEVKVNKGAPALVARLNKISKVIKGLQLRKEYDLLIKEMQGVIDEYGRREVNNDKNTELTYTDVAKYQEFAVLFSEVLSDINAAIENDGDLKTSVAITKANFDSFLIRLNMKKVDLTKVGHDIDMKKPAKQESWLGRNAQSLLQFSQPAFKLMTKLIGEAENKIRVDFNKAEKEISIAAKNLKEWANRNGMSLQKAYDKIIVEENGTLKLVSKYNGIFSKGKEKAQKTKDLEWLRENSMVTNSGKLEYTGKAKENFELSLKNFKERNDQENNGEDQAEIRESKLLLWRKKYDITLDEAALFNENNRYIYADESKSEFKSEFWIEANKPENKALLDYYNMYIAYNEKFARMTKHDVNSRFIANVTKDIIDSIGENGIGVFGRLKGIISKALEVRQFDQTRGSVVNGETVQAIPLIFLDALRDEVSKQEIKKIKDEIANEKDDSGNLKYLKDSKIYNDEVNFRVDKLKREKGNKIKSRDLSKSLLLFANTAYSYKHLSATEDVMRSTLFYLKTGGGAYQPKDKYGKTVRDGFGKLGEAQLGIPKKEIEVFEDFINALWYGQRTQGKDKLVKLFGREYSLTKGVQLLMKWISVKALGLNAFVAFGNAINTNASLYMSSVEGVSFKHVFRQAFKMLREDKRRFYAASALFETYAHDEKYEKVNKISASGLSKYITMDNAFILMKEPDKRADRMLLVAMMHSYGVEDGKLVKLAEVDTPNALINLMNYNKEKDEWSVEGLSEDDFASFRQKVMYQSFKIKGNRTGSNITETDLHIGTQALMQFRNWMLGTITNRFEELKYDDILLEMNQGRFMAFHNEMYGSWAEKSKALWKLSKEVLFIKSFSAKDEKMNMEAAEYYFAKFINDNPEYEGKLTLEQYLQMKEGKLRGLAVEVRILTAMMALIAFMGAVFFGGEGDEEDDITSSFARNTYRMFNRGLLELSFFFDPKSTMRSFVISPAAILQPIKDFPKLWKNTKDVITDYMYGQNSPNDETGFGYYTLKQVPFAGQYVSFFDSFGTWDYETARN